MDELSRAKWGERGRCSVDDGLGSLSEWDTSKLPRLVEAGSFGQVSLLGSHGPQCHFRLCHKMLLAKRQQKVMEPLVACQPRRTQDKG